MSRSNIASRSFVRSAAFGKARQAACLAALGVAAAVAAPAMAATYSVTYTVPAGGVALNYAGTLADAISGGVVGSFPGTAPAILTGFSYTALTSNTTGGVWPSDIRIGIGISSSTPSGPLNDIVGLNPFSETSPGPGGPITNSFTGLESNYWFLPGNGQAKFFAYTTYSSGTGSLTGGTITATYDTNIPAPPTAPSSTAASVGGSVTGTLGAGSVAWYSFNYSGSGALAFDTEGTTLAPSNDTVIGLFSSYGSLVAIDDDGGTGLLSALSIADGELGAGTYYLAVGAYDTVFDNGFTATSTSANTGAYVLNGLTTAPEPASLSLIGLAGVAVIRRRR